MDTQTTLPTISTALFRASTDCPDCHGRGYVWHNEQQLKCNCLLKQEALHYITPTYADAKYIKAFDPGPMLGKKILIHNESQALYKSIFKSFLLNTGMKYTHATASGYEVMQAYLTNTESQEYTRLSNLDLLALYLVADPFNRAYSNVLISLIQKRDFSKKATWLYTPYKITDPIFTNLYGQELSTFVSENFTALNTKSAR